MSDSEASSAPARPSDTAFEKTLNEQTDILVDENKATVNSIRTAAEKALGLESGFFKTDAEWKARSKEIINKQVVCLVDTQVHNSLAKLATGEEQRRA